VLGFLAGLQRLDGSCHVDGEPWQDGARFLPPWRRPIGYVFQEASLFPHLSVRRNILYGAPEGKLAIGFDEVVELFGIARLLDRAPAHLSGGERQRVAIARALLSQPKLLLMDEPLAALDRSAKDEILPFLERLRDQLSLPLVYVSHDIGEVERLADHLVLMKAGRILAAGPLAALQADPALPLATAREAAGSLEAVAASYDEAYGWAEFRVAGGAFWVPAAGRPAGGRRRLRIAAGDVSLARERPQATTILNILPARILSPTPVGAQEIVVLLGLGEDGAGARLLARVTRRSWEQLGLAEGLGVFAQVKGVALVSREAAPEAADAGAGDSGARDAKAGQ
jgi:molybdate transport system ATP-binding protein